jgi:hypothetical protein
MSGSTEQQKLLDLIALKSKDRGSATMPELHEACGLDVEAMYVLLTALRDAKQIVIEGDYPFEQIRPITAHQTPSRHA